jgi:hypothetical protein
MPRSLQPTRTMRTLALAAVFALAGCGDRGPSSATGSMTTAGLQEVLSYEKDCIYYRVAENPDGTETWNADYAYFYVLGRDGKPAVDHAGQPMGQGLLRSQLGAFMKAHPELGDDTKLLMQVSRQVQVSRGDSVLSVRDAGLVENPDLDELLKRAGE